LRLSVVGKVKYSRREVTVRIAIDTEHGITPLWLVEPLDVR
jgi:hypothetical protein